MSKVDSFADAFRVLKGKRTLTIGIAVAAAASAFIVYFSLLVYNNYRDDLIRSEQEELLTMARTVGKSLVNYVEQELSHLDLYFDSLGTVVSMEEEFQQRTEPSGAGWHDVRVFRAATEALLEAKKGLYDAVVCYDTRGRPQFEIGSVDFDFANAPKTHTAVICGKKLCDRGWYQLFLSKTCRVGERPLTLIYAVNLNTLYSMTVQRVKIGEGGYSIVKDRNLAIIMHHAVSQIGMDAIYDRAERYPQLDLTDLFRWIEFQRTRDEGYDVIDTYVWSDPGPTPSSLQRIVAYTTIHLPGDDWIVNSTLPLEELNGPLSRMMKRLTVMSSLSLLLIVFFVFIMTRAGMKAVSQKKEIAYLKEINEGMELLRHKEDEIQHYQRIQSIGQMSSHIAHEFNNYLTPVLVYGELLESDAGLSAENRELVSGILDSAGQAAGLSRKLLDFSRHDSAAALTTLCLTEDVRQALDIIRRLTPEKITLRTELDEESLYTRGRSQMAEHLLMNLCNNAFNAMEKSGGVLTVALRHVTSAEDGSACPPGDWAMLSVSDTGCGIGKDAMDKIFEPFYTTKGSGQGTGLGLSVVRNIVTASGGEICVDSCVGTGTTFYLYFPRVEEREALRPRSVIGRNDRILIVDDDGDVLRSLGALAKGLGLKAECYNHPAAVLSRLQNKKDDCDVLITDYAMPSMNGLEMAEIVRKLNPDIRLILISGMEDMRFDWYLKNQFIDAFILKSEFSEKLKKMIV